MGNQNSRVELLLGLYRETTLDLYDKLHTFRAQLRPSSIEPLRETIRDMQYVEKRVAAEGFNFLTISLPKLGKWVDRKLMGYDDAKPTGFSRHFLEAPFALLEELTLPGRSATTLGAEFIRGLRTLLTLYYKLELPPTDKQVQLKLQEFIDVEKEVHQFVLPADNRVAEWARHVLDVVVGGFDPLLNFHPKHGPGAVATHEKGDDKWLFKRLYASVHEVYPYWDFLYGLRENGRRVHLAAHASRWRAMERLPYPVARLVTVPKDSRGPRIISCEPLEVQFLQQGIAHRLMKHLEENSTLSRIAGEQYPCRHINFYDQSINAQLALTSSRLGNFATIDLAEASDRVSLALFESLWPERQQKYFKALRSHATLLPDGSELQLAKFAPMGSALCFPVESAIFYALCVAALLESGEPFARACRSVYVYGDDIVIPCEHFNAVRRALEEHGLKVNESKCCVDGYFRESCGTDAWHGHVVTPTRIRKLPGESPRDGTALAAWAAYSGHFYSNGMENAGRYCKQVVETVLREEIPFVDSETGYLAVVRPGHRTELSGYKSVEWSTELSMPTAKVWSLRSKGETSGLSGYDRLFRNILVSNPLVDPSRVVGRSTTQISKRRRGLIHFSIFDWLLSA